MEPLRRRYGKPILKKDGYYLYDMELIVNQRLNTNINYIFLGELEKDGKAFKVRYFKEINDFYVFKRMDDYINKFLIYSKYFGAVGTISGLFGL